MSLINLLTILSSLLMSKTREDKRYKGSTPSSPKPDFGQFVPKFSQQEVSFLDDLKKISDLPEEHPVRQYVINRKIPEKYFDILYLADKFMAFVNKHKPKTFPHTKYDHRLIIPFYDRQVKSLLFKVVLSVMNNRNT